VDAQVYGFGLSEEFTGEFVRGAADPAVFQVASKMAPLPWRLSSGSVVDACRASLKRLGMTKVRRAFAAALFGGMPLRC
jgi:aryl-alcohol dehydrogenase-like predicted oxidoreductase